MSEDTKKYAEPDLDTAKERIEAKKDEFAGGPEPGWDKMDKTAQQLYEKHEQSIPSGPNEGNPQQDIPEDERQKRVIGTESTHY